MEGVIKKYDLTSGVAWKLMLRFTIPIFFGTLFQSLYTTVDAVILGNFAGKNALAAIESVYTLIGMPVNFFTGLASGATIIISQYFGAKKIQEVSKASHNAILFALIGGLILTLLGFLFSPIAIQIIKVPLEISQNAKWYLLIYFSGMTASMVYNVGAGILRALGNSKTPFYYLIASNILNIVLDLLFIGSFKWGVVGAAVATITSQYLSAFLIMVAMTKTDLPCKINIRKLRFYKEHLSEIFKLGLPIGIQSVLYPISNTIVQTSINKIGVNSIAAWAISGKLDILIWTISDAFCVSVSTFVAQNYGAEKYKRAREGVKIGLAMALLSISIVSITLYFNSEMLASLLVKDKNVITITSDIIKFLAPLYLIYVFCDVLPGAIRGTGETFKPMIITLLGTCLSRVIWILFIIPEKPTLIMVLSCYPVSWGITALLFIVFYLYIMSDKKIMN